MLHSVALSPTSSHNVLEKERFVSSASKRQEKSFPTRTYYGADLSMLNNKCATIPLKGHSAESGSRHSDVHDSFSDSTYSPSSDLSFNSDVGSLNTTSTDSDNNRIFHQGITRKDRFSALQQRGDARHVDEGFVKRVLMLMKVILYLRHNFPLQILPTRKVFLEMEKNKRKFGDQLSLCSNSSDACHETIEFCTSKSPRTQKRISFSPTTLLFSAVTENAVSEARTILEEEVIDVNAQTPSGQSLLHIAASNADLKCVQLLLQYGAEVNVKDANGWSPLHAAIRKGNWKCAILLIEAGADFAEYAQARIQEYNQVLRMSRTCFRSVEIFV